MKVYYVQSNLAGCYNVRCLLPLQANGWDGDFTSFIRNFNRPANDKSKAAQDADIVVFHRPEDKGKLDLARILKSIGKKIVFDNDDTEKDSGGLKLNEFINKEMVEKGMKTLNENIDAFIKEADLVTCSTEFLAKEYRELNKKVIVIPNCIDSFMFDEPLRNETDTVRIGITGSVAITSDMELIKPIVEYYKDNKKIKFVLFSLPPNKEDKFMRKLYEGEYEFWDSLDIEWQPFVPMEEYYTTLNELRLDMMIIPRADNYFNRCKSNLKFLESSMLEIPCICQSFPTGDSPYEVDKEDTQYLLLATDLKSWISQIDTLVENKELRLELGKKAHEYVEKKYDININAHRWEDAYKTL